MKKDAIKAITLGGIIAAIYVTITLISVYFLPILSVFGLFFMPLFAAYYSSLYKFKYVVFFNIATIFLTSLVGIGDITVPLLYVLPTLIIGDIYGILNRLNVKYYSTIFLQAVAHSIINLLTIYLGELITETQIIRLIIPDEWTYKYLSLSILFVLSGAEAVFCSMFTFEKLAIAGIQKEKETSYPFIGHIVNVVSLILSIVFSFINVNISLMIVCIGISSEIAIIINFIKKIKKKELLLAICSIVLFSLCFLLGIISLYRYIPIVLIAPISIYSLVYLLLSITKTTYKKQ